MSPTSAQSDRRAFIAPEVSNGPASLEKYFSATLSGMTADDGFMINSYTGASSATAAASTSATASTSASADSALLSSISAAIASGSSGAAERGLVTERVFFTTAGRISALDGYLDGAVDVQYADFSNNQPPANVVAITIPDRIAIPRYVGGAGAGAADLLFSGRLFMSLSFVPFRQMIQLNHSANASAFEMTVAEMRDDVVVLAPINNTIYLDSPLAVSDTFTISFRVQDLITPNLIPYPIMPIRVPLTAEFDGATNTCVYVVDAPFSINALAVAGAAYSVVVVFGTISGTLPTDYTTPARGLLASGFTATTFLVPSLIVSAPLPSTVKLCAYIPKNIIGFGINFTSIRNSKTNGLAPVRL